MSESDGAGAETDVVRGGGSAHSAGLGSTFSSPAAAGHISREGFLKNIFLPRAAVRFLPFQVVSDISWLKNCQK